MFKVALGTAVAAAAVMATINVCKASNAALLFVVYSHFIALMLGRTASAILINVFFSV